MIINLNKQVKVKLTEKGKEKLLDYYNMWNEVNETLFSKMDKNDIESRIDQDGYFDMNVIMDDL